MIRGVDGYTKLISPYILRWWIVAGVISMYMFVSEIFTACTANLGQTIVISFKQRMINIIQFILDSPTMYAKAV